MVRKSAVFLFVLGLLLSGISSASAQQYQLNLTAISKSTNAAGAIVNGRVSNPSILGEIFPDPPTARLHQLVFDVETGEVLVIQKGTGEVLGAWFLFTVDTLIVNSDGTKAEVCWNVTCPSDAGYQGTAAATVQLIREGESITKFKMAGKFLLRYQGDTGPRIISGVFSSGAPYVAP